MYIILCNILHKLSYSCQVQTHNILYAFQSVVSKKHVQYLMQHFSCYICVVTCVQLIDTFFADLNLVPT